MRILFFLGLVSTCALANPKTTFHDSQLRYLTGHDLFRVLRQKFPLAIQKGLSDECIRFGDATRAALGDPSPATGESVYKAPSAAYVRIYVRCVKSALELELQLAPKNPGALETFYGSGIQGLNAYLKSRLLGAPESVLWVEIAPAVQRGIVLHLVDLFIGPGILKDPAVFGEKVLAALTDTKLTVREALQKTVFLTMMTEEFLTY